MPARARRRARAPLAEARANAFTTDWPRKPPRQPGPGCTSSPTGILDDLRDYIDWTPFFRAWELHGNYPAILTDGVGESATQLFADAQAMLDQIIAKSG